jgi:hypothetical protein
VAGTFRLGVCHPNRKNHQINGDEFPSSANGIANHLFSSIKQIDFHLIVGVCVCVAQLTFCEKREKIKKETIFFQGRRNLSHFAKDVCDI